jgi:hypothetical protein
MLKVVVIIRQSCGLLRGLLINAVKRFVGRMCYRNTGTKTFKEGDQRFRHSKCLSAPATACAPEGTTDASKCEVFCLVQNASRRRIRRCFAHGWRRERG